MGRSDPTGLSTFNQPRVLHTMTRGGFIAFTGEARESPSDRSRSSIRQHEIKQSTRAPPQRPRGHATAGTQRLGERAFTPGLGCTSQSHPGSGLDWGGAGRACRGGRLLVCLIFSWFLVWKTKYLPEATEDHQALCSWCLKIKYFALRNSYTIKQIPSHPGHLFPCKMHELNQ